MSYTPTVWQDGDTITAEAMNKIERGIADASGVLVCTSSFDGTVSNYVLDKTAQEIYDALLDGTPVYIKFQYGTISDYVGHLYLAPVVKIYNYDSTNIIKITAIKPSNSSVVGSVYDVFTSGTIIYSASGLNEYPVFYKSVNTNANTTVQNITDSTL